MSVNNFINRLSCSEGDQVHEWVRATADLTVRLRVGYTGQDRPDGYPLSGSRGKSIPRVGTGWIWHVDSEINEPCPCDNCDGQEMRKYWRFYVRTAQHVVYDTEEAKRTRQDGKVVSVWALRVVRSNTENDLCYMECVTHDERIGEKVKSLVRRWNSLTKDMRSRSIYSKKSSVSGEGQVYTLIISHPHGQAKKITLGKQRPPVKDGNFFYHYSITIKTMRRRHVLALVEYRGLSCTQRVMTCSYVAVSIITLVTFIAGQGVPQSPQTKSTTDTMVCLFSSSVCPSHRFLSICVHSLALSVSFNIFLSICVYSLALSVPLNIFLSICVYSLALPVCRTNIHFSFLYLVPRLCPSTVGSSPP